jgi:hypothetical protein
MNTYATVTRFVSELTTTGAVIIGALALVGFCAQESWPSPGQVPSSGSSIVSSPTLSITRDLSLVDVTG